MKIGNRTIGRGKCYIIAEAGVNHNGDISIAKELIIQAAKAGADCVKFQTFKTDELVSETAPKAGYQNKTTDPKESQADMLRKLELSEDQFKELQNLCKKSSIDFMSTPFDRPSIHVLNRLNVDAFKVPSAEVPNIEFIKYLAGFGKPLIISTGMCTLGEVDKLYQELIKLPIEFSFLHCVTEYPSQYSDTNLLAMNTMSTAFQVPIGYSDHTMGIHIPIASVALGAEIIEKHFTLDRSMKGPDHKASIEPKELAKMVKSIRQVESALGNGIKSPKKIELKNAEAARKSLVASRDLPAGTVIDSNMLVVKRPGTGLTPSLIALVEGMVLVKSIKRDDVLTESHFKA